MLSSTDNGVGYGIENTEDNTATLVTSLKSSGPARRTRHQPDKVSNGAQTLSNAAGTGAATLATTTGLDSMDGTLTSGAANTQVRFKLWANRCLFPSGFEGLLVV